MPNLKSNLKAPAIAFGISLAAGCATPDSPSVNSDEAVPANNIQEKCWQLPAMNQNSAHRLCEPDAFELQLLHFADVDGGRDILNNAVRFSAILDNFRSKYKNTIVLSSGDNWIPGPEYNVGSDQALQPLLGVPAVGRAHVAYLNALGTQASAVGNHELDFDVGEFVNIISRQATENGTWVGAQFPYLSANMDFSSDTDSAASVSADGQLNTDVYNKIAASTIVDINGELIGVVGASTPKLPSITKVGDVTVTPVDSSDVAALAKQIQTSVDQLTDEGINKIILLAHMQQISVEIALAPLLKGVDIIIAGGSNTLLADSTDRLRDGDAIEGDYPLLFQSASGEPVVVVNVDGDYTYLGRFVTVFDQDGALVPALFDTTINGAYATDEQGLVDLGLTKADAIPKVQAITAGLSSALEVKVGNVFGNTSVYLNGERGSVRTEETNLGNLTSDANLAYAQSVDPSVAVAIKNGGGIRAPIGQCIVPPGSTSDQLECSGPMGTPGINHPGDISQLDMEIALRLNNSLTNLTVTGAQLKQVLEHSVSATGPGVTPGRFPQISGMRFSFDPTKLPGSRVVNLVVLDDNGALEGGNTTIVVQDGQLKDTAAGQRFRLSTLGFLAGGGDGYPFPNDAAANVVQLKVDGQRTGNITTSDDGTEQDVLAEYLFKYFPPDTDPSTPSFDMPDLPAAQDQRIQNLQVVPVDTILNN